MDKIDNKIKEILKNDFSPKKPQNEWELIENKIKEPKNSIFTVFKVSTAFSVLLISLVLLFTDISTTSKNKDIELSQKDQDLLEYIDKSFNVEFNTVYSLKKDDLKYAGINEYEDYSSYY